MHGGTNKCMGKIMHMDTGFEMKYPMLKLHMQLTVAKKGNSQLIDFPNPSVYYVAISRRCDDDIFRSNR